MKKVDLKSSRLKKVVALLLVTTVAIGLVSSTAIKLVSATYYMQNKRKLATSSPVVNKIIDAVNNNSIIPVPGSDSQNAPTEAPSAAEPTTEAPAASVQDTQAPATEKAPETTEKKQSEETTKAPATEETPTSAQESSETEPQTDSPEVVKQKQDILSKYKKVVNYAKSVGKPGYQKVTYRTLEKDTFSGTLLRNVVSAYPDYFVSKENAEASPEVFPVNNDMSAFCIDNNKYACMLANADASEAIKSATNVKLSDGSRKITIVLRDEVDPEVTAADAKKAASFTSAMFPVISAETVAEKVGATLSVLKVSSASLTYSDCTVELIYNPNTNRVISMTQTVKYTGNIKGSLGMSSKGVVTEVYEYSDFNYGLI